MLRGLPFTLVLLSGCGTFGLDQTWLDPGDDRPGPVVDSGEGQEDSEPQDDTRDDPEESAPELTSFAMTERPTSATVSVTFESLDQDNDLIGGSVHFTLGQADHVLTIPTDLDAWNASGESRFQVEAPSLPGGTTVEGSLYLVDAAGNRSSTLSDSLVLADDEDTEQGITVPESGDTYDTAYDLGIISLPVTVQGELDAVSHDASSNYTGDYDWLMFRLGTTTSATMTLSWTAANGDYDLILFDGASGQAIAQAQAESTTPPENITRSLTAGTTYYLLVVGWSGAAGDWTVLFH
jgi:hypothetical protein